MKKATILCLVLCLIFSFCGCGNTGNNPSGDDNKPPEVEQPVRRTEFISVHSGNSQTVSTDSELKLEINKELDGEDYLKILFSSDVDIIGYINYTADGEACSEVFYSLKGNNQEFRQILNFHQMNFSVESLDYISIKSISGSGTVSVTDVSIAQHPIDMSDIGVMHKEVEEPLQIYLKGKKIKLGISLQSGGAINSLSHADAKACKVGSELYVGLNGESKEDFDNVEYTDVNLINTHDSGRLVQQSYYGVKSGFDGYVGDKYGGKDWPYNPVQGGDKSNASGQVVDAQIRENEVYIKTRPLDWAKSYSVMPAYMENVYSIAVADDGTEYVQVKNTYTDFSGYNHNNVRHQELPAYYGIAPLGTAVYYNGNAPFSGGELTNNNELPSWAVQTDANRLSCDENWICWVNEDNWGVGLYVPEVTSVLAGRADYNNFYFELKNGAHLSSSTTYSAPLMSFSLTSYDSFSYTYYLSVGTVTQNRSLFYSLRNGGATNAQLAAMGTKAW